jgi:hypothetical protein
MIVVIPTNRAVNFAYLRPLIDAGARFFVIDDSEGRVEITHPQFTVLNWNDRRRMLGPWDEFFPRRNGSCRLFGFYVAWKESDANEVVVALDDDCEVYHEDFGARVEAALSVAPRPVASGNGRHLNIFDAYEDVPAALFPRGFSYSARLDYERCELTDTTEQAPAFCLGMWQNVFDVNAVDKIAGPAYIHPAARLTHPSVVIAPSHLVSVCSMNMQFRRELIPAVFQFPMHVEVMPGCVVDRYGDIWGGFVQKLLMDSRRGLSGRGGADDPAREGWRLSQESLAGEPGPSAQRRDGRPARGSRGRGPFRRLSGDGRCVCRGTASPRHDAVRAAPPLARERRAHVGILGGGLAVTGATR